MRKIVTVIPFVALSLMVAGGGSTGCVDTPTETIEINVEIDDYIDCAVACGAYRLCVDTLYDVSWCIDTCRAESEVDEGQRAAVSECAACVEAGPCIYIGEFFCTDECSDVVP